MAREGNDGRLRGLEKVLDMASQYMKEVRQILVPKQNKITANMDLESGLVVLVHNHVIDHVTEDETRPLLLA